MSALIILIGFLLSLLPSCKETPPPAAPTQVKAFQVEPHTIPADFEFVGVAKSSHPVEIRARVEGYLDAIAYLEGSMVDPGTLLFQLDPRPFIASLEAAKGALARQEAVLWRAQKSFERIKPLYEQNAASQRDYDDAYAQVLVAEAQVIIAKANVVQAELNLSYTHITSPIKGLTGRAAFREGTLITPSVNGLLTYVSIIDPIWVLFSVSDNELLQGRAEGAAQTLILPDQHEYQVVLTLADGSTFPHVGKVNFTSPQLDAQTGTLTVRATFPNPDGLVIPGQFVRATVKGALRPNALFVPQSAVFQGDRGMFVFVINSDNTVALRQVQPGVWFQNYWVINSGIEAGERVVAEGVNKIRNGSIVQIASTEHYTEKEG